MEIIGVHDRPAILDTAADYFHSRWGVPRHLYADSMNESLTGVACPRWYVAVENDTIIGCFGIIPDDFMKDSAFGPWLAAIYVEPDHRGRGLGGTLLNHAVKEAGLAGFDKLYLNTDHVGYYERYGWQYVGDFPHTAGDDARVYVIETN